jgi:hypothetical protein
MEIILTLFYMGGKPVETFRRFHLQMEAIAAASRQSFEPVIDAQWLIASAKTRFLDFSL